MDPLLERARDARGDPLFFPAGEHPEMEETRRLLRLLRPLERAYVLRRFATGRYLSAERGVQHWIEMLEREETDFEVEQIARKMEYLGEHG